MSKIDVGFGIPLYMQPYWDESGDYFSHVLDSVFINEELSYTHGDIDGSLENIIRITHETVGNAVTEGSIIVVGNGASQVISAVGYASKALGYADITLNAPYWGRLDYLLKSGQSAYTATKAVPSNNKPIFDFVTRPNNPNSSMRDADPSFSVVDMCYNWPQYVPEVEKGDYDIMIFSLAKATGHAGTRIGWAVVKDPKVAELMKEYMEISTCGVSVDSQRKADGVLTRILSLSRFFKSPFDYAKDELSLRWEVFKNTVKDNNDFKLLNQHGMFAFCELSSNNEPVSFMDNKYNMIVTPGRNLGLTNDSNCFRINLGCSEDNFTKMIGSLRANKPSITGN